MAKARKELWHPQPVIVEIGTTEYTVVPQPLRRYIEFESRLQELVGGIVPSEEPEEGEPLETVTKGIVEQGVEVIYEVLKCMIPDLKHDDVLDAPEPQLEHAIEVVLRINGGKWAEALVRDFFGPILPALKAILADWLLGATARGETGETPQTT